jgi:hypothetical protein
MSGKQHVQSVRSLVDIALAESNKHVPQRLRESGKARNVSPFQGGQ